MTGRDLRDGVGRSHESVGREARFLGGSRVIADRPLLPSIAASVPKGTSRRNVLERLLIVGRVMHYRHEGRFHSYAPYVREIDLWADLFSHVTIASSLVDGPPPGDCTAFTRSNITVRPMLDAGGHGIRAKTRKMFALPSIVIQLCRNLISADAVHVRCPSDLGLLGVLFAPLFSRFVVAKYAGQWMRFDGEPWSSRLQRALLRSRWWRGPVTVYGDWPGEPDHVVPFFTSGLTAAQIERARKAASRRGKTDVLRVLYVGRLSPDKNVHALIEAIARTLDRPGKAVECMIIGDGPERAALESLSARLGLRSRVTFTGGVPIESVLDHYERADVLVLASNSEGWPKAITEAMAFGLLCVGSARGLIPQILGDGRGILVPPGNPEALFDALQWVRERPLEALEVSRRAAEWSQRYSLESLRDALRALLEERWQVPLRSYAGSSGGGQG